MPEVSKATLKTYFEDGKEPDENKFIDLVDTLWEQGGGGVDDHGDLTGLGDDDHSQYLLADGTRIVSGDFTVGAGDAAYSISIDGAAGFHRNLVFKSGGVDRWRVRTQDTAESGSNVGSDFEITGRKDDGTWLNTPLKIIRSTGEATFVKDLTIGSAAGARRIIVDGAADQYRGLYLRTAGEIRFAIVLDDIAESGSAAGSDLNIWRYDDDEVATLDFAIDRSTGDLYQFKDIRCGGGLYVGGTGNPPPQGVIQSVSDIRAGGGLVVGSTSPNPASGYGVMGGGLSIGNLTPPYAIRGTLYFEFGTPKYGFISATEPLFMSAGTLYDGAVWRQLGSSTSATFYINNTAGLIFRTDQTSRSPGDVNTHANVLTVDLDGNMKLKGGIVVGYISGAADNDNITFYQGTTRMGEIGSDNTAWLKINHVTNKPIWSPRYMRIDGGISATANVSDAGDGYMAAQMFRLYEGATELGRFEAQDATWTRINQGVSKNVYSPRSIVIAGGLMSGTSYLPGAGYTGYTVALRPYKNTTGYITYSYHAYATKKTSGSFNGDAKSTTGATKIDLSAVFGVPAGVKAVQARIYARDSAGHILTAQYLGIGYSAADPFLLTVRPVGNNQITENNGIVTCDANGDIYWRCGASGGGTLDVWIEILGYFI